MSLAGHIIWSLACISEVSNSLSVSLKNSVHRLKDGLFLSVSRDTRAGLLFIETVQMMQRINFRNVCRKVSYLAVVLFLFHPVSSYARPDMSPLGRNLADKGSAFYHFSVTQFDSADGKRHYKVWTGIPDKPPSASGYSVIYMLDGNAVMDRFSDPLLKKLSEKNPPVIVVIGYQTDLPFDLPARAYDYTPAVEGNTVQTVHGRAAGGSLIFRHLIEQTIAPRVEKGLNIDRHKRAIWGHSLGGVFVLDTYLSSSFFTVHYAASPTLNSHYAGLLTKLEAMNKQRAGDKQLSLMEGSGEPGKNPQAPGPDILNKVRVALSLLHTEGLATTYWSYPSFTHGQMFNVGFEQALLNIAGADPQQISAR